MKRFRMFLVLFLSIFIALEPAVPAFAAGEVQITKSNWQSVDKLLPDSAVKWVKSGEMVLRYGSLDYDPNDVVPKWVIESKKQNVGKYKLNSKFAIVDAGTGKMPSFIKGIPFPDIKINDPQGAAKVMWNCLYMRDANGAMNDSMELKFFGRRTGYERSIMAKWYSKAFDGYEPSENVPNPNNFESVNQILITSPYDMAGTALMTWRYRTDQEDMLYGYVPAIRRVRRLTPAGRSDAMFGSDFARDDGSYGNYDGNIKNFKWRIIGEGEVLGAYISSVNGSRKPEAITQTKSGEWKFNLKDKSIYKYSYQNKGGSAAPWFVDGALWVKRPVWIIEGIPKDPYYNYGRQIHYIDKELNLGYWKVIYDRSGKYWKTLYQVWMMGQDSQKTVNVNAVLIQTIVDERVKHSTMITNSEYICEAKIDNNQFSLAGFTAICK